MSLISLGSRERISTRQALRLFFRYATRYSDATQSQYRKVLYRFLADMPEFAEDITAEHIDIHFHKLKVSNNSKNAYMIAIRSFYRYLQDFHDLPNVVAKVNDFRKEPSRQRVISQKEYSQILKVASEKERAVVRFLCNTGLRSQEFCELTTRSISPDLKTITIIGKGSRRRVVPLNQTCRDCWPDIFYKKWTRFKLTALCRKLTRRTKLPAFGPHAFRHFFVTSMIKKGVSRSIVAKICGMSETVLSKTYLHLLDSDVVGITDILDSNHTPFEQSHRSE